MSKHETETERAERRAARMAERAERRRMATAALLQSMSGAETAETAETEQSGAAALATLTREHVGALRRIAQSEAARIPAALRSTETDGADALSDALLRLASTVSGRRTLRRLSTSHRSEAEAAVRMTVRSVMSNRLRPMMLSLETETALRTFAETAAPLTREAETRKRLLERGADGRTVTERAAVKAALEADGAYLRPDADAARRYAMSTAAERGRAAGVTAARAAGYAPESKAEAERASKAARAAVKREGRAVRRVLERHETYGAAADSMVKSRVLMLRETSLERLLTETMTTLEHGAAPCESGRSVTDVLADRMTAGAFRDDLRTALERHAHGERGRGAALLRTAALALCEQSEAETAETAREWREAARTVRAAADAAEAALRSGAPAVVTEHGDGREAARDAEAAVNVTAAERKAARKAAASLRLACETADVRAAVSVSLALLRRERPLSLADVLEAALTVTADGGAALRQRVSKRAEAAGVSTLESAAVLAYLRLDTAPNGAAAVRLRTVLRAAADDALSLCGVRRPAALRSVSERPAPSVSAYRLCALAMLRRYVRTLAPAPSGAPVYGPARPLSHGAETAVSEWRGVTPLEAAPLPDTAPYRSAGAAVLALLRASYGAA